MKYLMKTVNALIAAAIFPVIFFLDLIFIQLGTNENAQPLFEQIKPGTPGVGIEDSLSIYEIIQIARGDHIYSDLFGNMASKGGFTWPAAFDPINGRLIAFPIVSGSLIRIFFHVQDTYSYVDDKDKKKKETLPSVEPSPDNRYGQVDGR